MAAVLALSTALPVRAAAPARRSTFAGSALRVQQRVRVNATRAMAARAESKGVDFDAILAKGAEAWEAAPNKPVLVGYGVAGLVRPFNDQSRQRRLRPAGAPGNLPPLSLASGNRRLSRVYPPPGPLPTNPQGAIYVAETVVHWPLLNILLGFPLELLGITTAGYLALRYLKEGEDPVKDISAVGSSLAELLPGLKE